jgi:hypothetical protein
MGTARDLVIIIWGVVSILSLLIVMLITLMIGLSVRNLIGTVNDLIGTGVKPVIETTQQTVVNVTGTTQFLGDTIVTPIIRLFSFISGLRRGIAVFTGLSRRLPGRRGGDGGGA